MDLRFRGNAYIVVGGSKGMGFAAARRLAEGGANLAIVSRSTSSKDRAAALAVVFGIRAVGFSADASRRGEIEKAVEQAIAEFGTIRGLLTTPGSTDHNGTLLDMTDDDWDINFQDVLMSQVRSCRAILPHLLENGGGQLVTTAAYSARAPKPFLFAYASLKAALVNFTKNVAKTYGAQGVRANCICPGAIETEQLEEKRHEAAKTYGLPVEEALEHVMFEEWKMPVAMRSVGQPDDVADLMAFALSDRAGYMTGAAINIDGGTDF
jgi:3-oxoacyl-[acyl-carrier protein] reductase